MSKKNVLLVKPDYAYYPVGLAYVMRELEVSNIPFDYVDTHLEKKHTIEGLLSTNDYLAVATGGLSADANFYCELRKTVKENNPKTPFILGGNVVKDTMYTNKGLLFEKDRFGIDFGVHGEVEGHMVPLLNKLKAGDEDYSDIPGIVYIDQTTGQPQKNKRDRFSLEIENRFPMWEKCDVEYYKVSSMPFLGNIEMMPIISGRGCMGVCSFCSPTVGRFGKRPVNHIMAEIDWLQSNWNFEFLWILNEMFYDTVEDVYEFCTEYKKLYKKSWGCNFRAEMCLRGLDAEVFKVMKDAGCVMASAGIESGSNQVLDLMKKQTPASTIAKFCNEAKKAEMPVSGTFIVGNEGEDEEELAETIDMVIDNDILTDSYLLDVYPGTLAYKHALKKGLITDEWHHLNNVSFGNYTLWNNDMGYKTDYVNVSEIPNEVFWPTIYRQLRRFETHFYNKLGLKNLRYKRNKNYLTQNVVKIEGNCSECNAKISSTVSFDYLGQLIRCEDCYQMNYAHYHKTDSSIEYYNYFKKQLSNAKRILIVGENHSILKYDIYGIDYDQSVLGFLKITAFGKNIFGNKIDFYPYTKNKNEQRFGDFAIAELKPDMVVIVDDEIGNSEIVIRNLFNKFKIAQPQILHSLPDHMRRYGSLFKLLSKTNSSYNNALSKFINLYLMSVFVFMNEINMDKKTVLKRLLLKVIPKGYALKIRTRIKKYLGTFTTRTHK